MPAVTVAPLAAMPLLQSHARWSGSGTDPTFLLVRLAISTSLLVDDRLDPAPPPPPSPHPRPALRLDARNADALLALCIFCEKAPPSDTIALRGVLTAFYSAADWAVASNVDHCAVLERCVQSALACSQKLKEPEQKKIACLLVSVIAEWSKKLDTGASIDPIYTRKCVSAAVEGLRSSLHLILPSQIPELCAGICDILDETAFDIRLIISDAPAEFRLEEVVSEHFAPTIQLLLLSTLLLGDTEHRGDVERIRTLCVDYFQCLASYLINSISEEPFLCRLLHVLSELYTVLDLMHTEAESVLSIIQSFKYFKNYSNFAAILEPTSNALLPHAQKSPESIYHFINAIKSILFALSIKGECPDFPDPFTTISAGGKILGSLLKFLLPTDRVFCESLVSNLMVEFPTLNSDSAPSEADLTAASLAVILGNIATTIDDDPTSRICLSSLLTRFNKSPPTDSQTREYFFTQFSLIASTCGNGAFNIVIDTFVVSVKSEESHTQTLESLSSLARLVATDPIKKEVLLFTLLRLFVEKGLSLIGVDEKGKKTSIVQTDLDTLLQIICTSLQTFDQAEVSRKSNHVDIFQEFWLTLIFLGYQQDLAWRREWVDYIPIVARASPILVKERDKLQSPGSTFSQVVLSQSINPSLRNHLGTFLPNSSSLLRNITFAQCLWLLAIYFSEVNKLRSGFFENVSNYLQSDIIDLLGLYPFVEDLMRTVISRWKSLQSDPCVQDVELARILLANICHIQSRTHKTSLNLLTEFFIDEFSVFSDIVIWQAITEKLSTIFFICRSELGALQLSTVSDKFTRDINYARDSFKDLLNFGRQIFDNAARYCPNLFFKFAKAKIASVSSESLSCYPNANGDHDVALLELLRLVIPTSRAPQSPEFYLSLDTLLYRNAEEFVRGQGEGMSAMDQNSFLRLALDFSDPAKVKSSICDWLSVSQNTPSKSSIILSSLVLQFDALAAALSDIPSKNPLRSKLTATPSKPIDRQKEINASISTAIIFDFLLEKFQLDQLHAPDLLPLYLDLVNSTLPLIRRISLRFVSFRALLFGFKIVQTASMQSRSVIVERTRENLYSAMVHFLCHLTPFANSPGVCSREELSIIRSLLRLLVEESTVPKNALGKNKRACLATACMIIIQVELQDTLVWLGDQPDKKLSHQESIKDLLYMTSELSLDLSRRLIEHLKPTESIPFELWKRNGKDFAASSALASFALDRLYPVAKEAWIYAAPLLIPSAICAFRNSALKSGVATMNFSMRSLEEAPAQVLYFYIPQLVQSLRHDNLGFIERSILHIANASFLFSHQIIWNMKANSYLDETATRPDPTIKDLLDQVTEKIIRQFDEEERIFYEREFSFFEKVTSISGALKSHVKKEKWEKKAKIDDELRRIEVDPGLYLPSNPEYVLEDIDYESGKPLQSHAKAPFMATFKVKPARTEEPSTWQSVIFKVGDDCRQDVLALQLISLIKEIFEAHNLPVYLFPYRVIATAAGCGIIEVIPKSISRDQLGREKINSLYEYFVFRFGGESTRAFHDAMLNFVKSMAAYSIVCYLLAIKDRHNGNIMISDSGHIIHIDFGFILDIAPGGITFENAPFKLTSEMLQVMGGKAESPYFRWFRELCVQAFLICRCYADPIVQLVEAMSESALPCFKGEKTIRNLKSRFRLDLDSASARAYMFDLVYKSSENVRTNIYDRYQLSTNGIPY